VANEVLVRVRSVGKAYAARTSPLKHMAGLLLGRTGTKGFRALHDVSFSLSRGEALGLVGRNGAGKSTLLQIVCGTLTPAHGEVEMTGRVAAMLELGAGFNPEFTGRENVYLSASVYGLSDLQIEERFSQIVAFADIGDFIDRSVKEYSSGMYARLAFAVCAHVDADVLIIDEILGVGDAAFQMKCRRFLESFLLRGAIIFVSHDEHAVLSICNRAIWLDHGRQMAEGPPKEVLRLYRKSMDVDVERPSGADTGRKPSPDMPRPSVPEAADSGSTSNPISVSRFLSDAPWYGLGGAVIEDVYLSNSAGQRLDRLQGGQAVVLNIKGKAMREVTRPIVGFIFRNALGQNLFGDNTFLEYRDRPQPIGAGDQFHAILEFRIPYLPLGTYTVAPSLIDGTQQNHIQLYWMEEALVLSVHESPVSIGKIGVPLQVATALRPALYKPSPDIARSSERR
jgi:lipopolysaccharide transport system ATP-binding protein